MKAYAFFLPPFFPFEILLFFPTAMIAALEVLLPLLLLTDEMHKT